MKSRSWNLAPDAFRGVRRMVVNMTRPKYSGIVTNSLSQCLQIRETCVARRKTEIGASVKLKCLPRLVVSGRTFQKQMRKTSQTETPLSDSRGIPSGTTMDMVFFDPPQEFVSMPVLSRSVQGHNNCDQHAPGEGDVMVGNVRPTMSDTWMQSQPNGN